MSGSFKYPIALLRALGTRNARNVVSVNVGDMTPVGIRYCVPLFQNPISCVTAVVGRVPSS